MVIARPVKGANRSLKSRISMILFAIYFAMPFIKINGNQSFLLDITERRFYVFGMIIGPNEMYFLHMLLLFLGVLLFFATAMWGRIWCGFACPQTIFTEAYDFFGRLVVGSRYGKKTMNLKDKILANSVWLLLSVVFSYIFISYFAGADYMWERLKSGIFFNPDDPAWLSNWVLGVGASSAIAFGNMAYFRENMCRLACPYGRFQTALLDKDSPIVTYDKARGEPRRQKGQKEGEGDCTACNMCNLVCPTGIDIREGLQIGCLTCGLCVDACTIEMGKKDKVTLIDWKTIEQTENPEAPRNSWRTRTIIYGILLLTVIGFFSYRVVSRVPIQAIVYAEPSTFKMFLPELGIRTDYTITLGNFFSIDKKIRVELVSDYPELKLMSGEKYEEYKINSTQALRPRIPVLFSAETKDQLPDMKVAKFTFKIYAADEPEKVKLVKSQIRLK